MTGGGAPKTANKMIVLTLMASGSVSDYSDTSALRRAIAASAGVAPSSTVITVAPASVIITATITVPASSAASVLTLVSSTLGTAADASAALGITVESDPTVAISSPKTVTDAGASNVEGDSDSSSMGPIIGGAVGAVAAVAALVGVGVYVKMKAKKPPASAGGGQAQGGVTLSAPAQSTDEKI
jgi:hypothetical protein